MRVAALRGLTTLSLLGSVALGAAIYWQSTRQAEDPASRPVQAWSPDMGHEAPTTFAEAQPRNYPETFARPVFSPTRRPFAPPPPPAPPAPEPVVEPPPPQPVAAPDASQLQLKGIMFAGATARALVVSPESPSGQWLTVGSTIMGWKLTRIGDDVVSLDAGTATAELKLYVDNRPN